MFAILGDQRLIVEKPDHVAYWLPDGKHQYHIVVRSGYVWHSVTNDKNKIVDGVAWHLLITHKRLEEISLYSQKKAASKYRTREQRHEDAVEEFRDQINRHATGS